MTEEPRDGIWATGLVERTVEVPRDKRPEGPRELTLLWRRSKFFRRHRTYGN